MSGLSRVREARISYGPSLGDAPRAIRNPQEARAVLAPLVSDWTREHFLVLLLDGRHQYRGSHLVSLGTATASLVHPREVFRAALIEPATAAIIIGHNHPSGSLVPSGEDREVASRLREAGKLLGVPVLDSVIFNEDGEAYSMREQEGGW